MGLIPFPWYVAINSLSSEFQANENFCLPWPLYQSQGRQLIGFLKSHALPLIGSSYCDGEGALGMARGQCQKGMNGKRWASGTLVSRLAVPFMVRLPLL